ncbi:MAG: hypothetical protein HC838_09295 [Spirulinaceae cyanobacterium RM2_2_10]|nr:hypothetical protein [bacterium]NJO20200.1 hypothetical protein [Spirulinaceae cyanobacterium RM2_2_10]
MPVELNLDKDHECVIQRKPKPKPAPPDPLPPLVILSLLGFSVAVIFAR